MIIIIISIGTIRVQEMKYLLAQIWLNVAETSPLNGINGKNVPLGNLHRLLNTTELDSTPKEVVSTFHNKILRHISFRIIENSFSKVNYEGRSSVSLS